MRLRLFLLISALALFFDQLTKFLVQRVIMPYQIHPIIGDFLRITLVYNPGGIFGMRIFSDVSYYLMPLIGIVIVILLAIRSKTFFYLTAYGLILGGAIGNLWDRFRMGKVVDFIDIGIKNLRWYTFNLADAYIVVGIIMLLVAEILRPKPETTEKTASPLK